VNGSIVWFSVASYGLAGLAYAGVAVMLLLSHPGSRPATWLTAAAVVSSMLGAGIAVLLLAGYLPLPVVIGFDALHLLVWIGCVLSWFATPGARMPWNRRGLYAATACGLSGWALALALLAPGTPAAGSIFPSMLGASLIGLLVVEQIFRNTRDDERRSLLFLSAALSAIFLVDVVVYAQATLLDGLAPFLWQGKGIANAALAPLLLLAAKRRREWERALFVSRQVAFYTASLVGVGAYLLAMVGTAYLIRSLGGEWGLLLQTAFLLLSVVVLMPVLISGGIRARFKVLLVKHFYRHKYDYRQEWLRLTASLGRSGDLRHLLSSALAGIARIVGSERGSIWLVRDGGRYERMESLAGDFVGESIYGAEHPIVRFLISRGWVIDSEEYAREPDRYGTAFGAAKDLVLPRDSITVPVDCQGTLQGFVILLRPSHTNALNFEDHDILKTAGRQVGVVLAQAIAQDTLAETRQFEAVNKLTTFLMHDLKNLIAQQSLVVANAQRFQHRPEFIVDAIGTVRAGVERMRKVLDQLQHAGKKEPQWGRVDAATVLMEVRSQCADREPVPAIKLPPGATWATVERECLASVLTHLIRNAQDATPLDGHIEVRLERADDSLSITVADNGRGMDPAFVRDRLFRPFDSTKGAQGMGIGVYQARDIVRSAGGDLEVRSELGVGTVFVVRLPLARVAVGEEIAV
jgi:putative PEP-CTERM system histidine kinase